MNNMPKWLIALLVVLIVICCLSVLCLAAVGTGVYFLSQQPTPTSGTVDNPGDGPADPLIPFFDPTPRPTQPVTVQTAPLDPAAVETLKTLEQAEVPVNDLRALAVQLGGKTDVPETVPDPLGEPKLGDQREFWASNVDTNENFKVKATLRYVGQHLYFWVDNGVRYNDKDLKKLADAFDTKIYPTDREFFGSEWTPGIDGDPRLYILYASGLGSNLAGYFSSADSVPPQAHEYSNGHEMFFFNADNAGLDEPYTYGVLAHEFQHMIHWYRDRNEESWLNEGFSELASFLNGYDTGGFDYLYLQDPDISLNDWPNDSDATSPHYGASFLFVSYFLDRFGEKATQALVADPQNGLDSVDNVLKAQNAVDSATGQPVTADSLFADWAVTNFLGDNKVGDGRYAYQRYQNAPRAVPGDTVSCASDWNSRSVSQYGVDYIQLDCQGKVNLQFEGSTEVGVLPEGAHSGKYAFWSNKGDESDMTLTQTFDFTTVSAPLEMSYWTWYDLEKDYDYAYLTASEDGKTWQIIQTPSSTDQDPSGNSYGFAYNGTTLNWIKESVDLSAYAGKKVTLRFQYITDAAVNGEGFMVDDIEIPAIHYQTDFEQDAGGWESAGFVRIQNRLPQTFILSLISTFEGKTTVQHFTLDDQQKLDLSLEINGDAVLVVSGSTRFTRQPAAYQFRVME